MARTSISDVIDERFDALKSGIKDLIDAGGDRAHHLKGTAITGIDKTGKLIKDHPLAAVMIAFGVGYLVMRIMRR
jgi:ElaB/YqjD/DUF883 family membrane-anchored ribosome-binding protein